MRRCLAVLAAVLSEHILFYRPNIFCLIRRLKSQRERDREGKKKRHSVLTIFECMLFIVISKPLVSVLLIAYCFSFVFFLCHARFYAVTHMLKHGQANRLCVACEVWDWNMDGTLHTMFVSARKCSTSTSYSFDFELLRLNGRPSIWVVCVVVVAAHEYFARA